MKIEYSLDDLRKLNFNYIVQIENHKHYDCIFDSENEGFWIEKRMKVVVVNDDACSIHGYYYGSKVYTKNELVEYLNHSESRYYRLLNTKELKWFCNWQKEQQA